MTNIINKSAIENDHADEIICQAIKYGENKIKIFPHMREGGDCVIDRKNKATYDIGTITLWFQGKYRGMEIGCLMGKESGLVCFDLEMKNGKDGKVSLKKLEAHLKSKLPGTWTNLTPTGGGQHLIFKYPRKIDIPSMVDIPGYPGIEIKSNGSRITLPPSRKHNGAYQTLVDSKPADLPDEWIQFLSGVKKSDAGLADKIKIESRTGFKVEQGRRNTYLTQKAGEYRYKGMDEPHIYTLLRLDNDDCEIPLPDHELKTIAHSIAAYPTSNNQKPKEVVIPKAHTMTEILSMTFPAIEWIVPDIIPSGITILSGSPKVGKSWLCLQLGISISKGGYAFGNIKVEKRKILYLDLEESLRQVNNRALSLNADFNDNLIIANDCPEGVEGLKYLCDMKAIHPDLQVVIIDTWQRFTGIQDTSRNATQYQRDVETVGQLKEIADKLNISIIVTHHNRKLEADDFIDKVYGSHGVTGSFNTILSIDKKRNAAKAKLSVTGRDILEKEFALMFDIKTGWSIMGDSAEITYSENRIKLQNLYKNNPKEIFTLKKLCDETGGDKNSVSHLNTRLLDDGYILKLALNKYIFNSGVIPDYVHTQDTPCTRRTPRTQDTQD